MTSNHHCPILVDSMQECTGNGAYLVFWDSRLSYNSSIVINTTIISALKHFGIPFRIRDLASSPLSLEELVSTAGIILAQEGISNSLTNQEVRLIEQAVKNQGTGLVNFDSFLWNNTNSIRKLVGITAINPDPGLIFTLRTGLTHHYINTLQDPGELHTCKRAVNCALVEQLEDDVDVHAQGFLNKDSLVMLRHIVPYGGYEPGNYPMLISRQYGSGKVVQFLWNPRLWLTEFFGRTAGLDDLFFRSIIWAARKPFAADVIPPFVTMSFDDCCGRFDFGYIDAARKYGFKPMPSLFLDRIPQRLFPKIKAGTQSGSVLFNTHAFDYYKLLTFDFGRGELPDNLLKENFAAEKAWWDKVGVGQPKTIRFHWGEYGMKALPFLKQTGRCYLNPAFQPGNMKVNVLSSYGMMPYNLQSYYYDYLPDDPDYYTFASYLARSKEDFLSGETPFLGESATFDPIRTAQSTVTYIRASFRSGFFADLLTHEQKFDGLRLDEWDQLLKEVRTRADRLNPRYVSHDDIGEYLLARSKRTIESCIISEKGLRISFNSLSSMTAGELSIFYEMSSAPGSSSEIEQRFIKLTGEREMMLPLA
jgi:hypothetical protein